MKKASPATSKRTAADAPPEPSAPQGELFDQAMRLFHARDFAAARAVFLEAAAGPAAEIAHSAGMYVSMCDRRLESTPRLQTPEDHYNYGVALMNQGRLPEASEHLRQAIAADGRAGHFHYSLALCSALLGDATASARHLIRAIEIEPGNRIAARNDADFQRAAAAYGPLRQILSG